MPSRVVRPVRNQRARVVAAHRHERPTVVVAGQQDVDLVAAHRPDLGLPELAGVGMEREAVTVAMAVREYFGLRAGAADERVVGRHACRRRECARSCRRGCPRSCAFMRRLLSSVPVQQSRSRSPTVTYSVSSGPNRILPPKIAAGFPGVGDEDFLDVARVAGRRNGRAPRRAWCRARRSSDTKDRRAGSMRTAGAARAT